MTNFPDQTQEHLHLLSIFHYVVGGITALFACVPLIHLVLGVVMLLAPESMDNPPRFAGFMIIIIACLVIVIGWTLAILIVIAGRCLARQTAYTFCLVMAAIECTMMPFGTVLGIFTIIVLVRPGVREVFAQSSR